MLQRIRRTFAGPTWEHEPKPPRLEDRVPGVAAVDRVEVRGGDPNRNKRAAEIGRPVTVMGRRPAPPALPAGWGMEIPEISRSPHPD